MARYRRKRRGGSRKAKSIPVAPLIPVAAVAINAMSFNGTASQKLNHLAIHTIGYDMEKGDFVPAAAVPFWAGEMVGIVVHKAANKMGVNNMVRRASFGYLSL